MTARSINYGPLSVRVSSAEADAVRRQGRDGAFGTATAKRIRGSKGMGMLLVSTVGGFFVLVFGITAVVQWALGKDPRTCAATTVAILAVLLAFYVVGRFGGRGGWRRTVQLIRFAQANGFSIEPNPARRALPGQIFQNGPHASTTDLVSWHEGVRDAETGQHTWTHAGAGANSNSVTYLAVRLGAGAPRATFDCGQRLRVTCDQSIGTDLLADEPDQPRRHRPRVFADAHAGAVVRALFTDDLVTLLTDDDHPANAEVKDGWFFAYYGGGNRLDEKWWRLRLATAETVARNADAVLGSQPVVE